MKVALMVQLLPAARVAPQVVVSAKLAALAPPKTMLPRFNVALPVLVSVTLEAALVVATLVVAKLMLVAESDAAGASPVPLNATVCGEPVALSLMERAADSEPLETGVKMTLTLQLLPTVRVDPQVVVSLNDEAAVPAKAITMPLSVLPPLFVNITVCAAVELPRFVAAKLSDVGSRDATGPVAAAPPAPARATLWVDPAMPPALSVTVSVAE